MNFEVKLELKSSIAICKGGDHIINQFFFFFFPFYKYSFTNLQEHAEKKGFKIINNPNYKSSAPFVLQASHKNHSVISNNIYKNTTKREQ